MRRNLLPTKKLITIADLRGTTPRELKSRLIEKFPALAGIFRDDEKLAARYPSVDFISVTDAQRRLYVLFEPDLFDHLQKHTPHPQLGVENTQYVAKYQVAFGARESYLYTISFNLYVIEQKTIMKGELMLPFSTTASEEESTEQPEPQPENEDDWRHASSLAQPQYDLRDCEDSGTTASGGIAMAAGSQRIIVAGRMAPFSVHINGNGDINTIAQAFGRDVVSSAHFAINDNEAF
jgi:hypothetical protein